MRHIPWCIFLLLCVGCGIFTSSSYPPLDVVVAVDLTRFAGKWYEIASLPVSAQKGCSCTTAEYTLMEDGVVRVANSCRKESVTGELDRVEGKAFIVPGSNNAKLRVQFFWPFRGDFWILGLDREYSYAVVGVPSRKYCWVLSRTPRMDEDLLQSLIQLLKEKGFDVSRLQRTNHDCPS